MRFESTVSGHQHGHFANGHNGSFPPDLGTLIAGDYFMHPAVFLCPFSGKTPPPDFLKLPLKERIVWVNENTDFEYLGKDLVPGLPPIDVAQDKPGHKHPVALGDNGEVTGKARINVLELNGHVEARWE
jgi:hypothetical protein